MKPATLSAAAAVIWDELSVICKAMGTLTTADVRPFATLCELQSTLDGASGAKDGRQLFRTQPESDDESRLEVVIDSVLRLERETATALRPYYALFGLEPISRARIQVPGAKEPDGKWAGALK